MPVRVIGNQCHSASHWHGGFAMKRATQDPAQMRPPLAVARRVRIASLVGVLVMHAMYSDPVDRAALQCHGAKDRHDILKPEAKPATTRPTAESRPAPKPANETKPAPRPTTAAKPESRSALAEHAAQPAQQPRPETRPAPESRPAQATQRPEPAARPAPQAHPAPTSAKPTAQHESAPKPSEEKPHPGQQ